MLMIIIIFIINSNLLFTVIGKKCPTNGILFSNMPIKLSFVTKPPSFPYLSDFVSK